MDLKSHPVFGYILISLGLVAVGESYWIFNRYSANKKAHVALVASVDETNKYKATDPYPSEDNAKLIATDLAAAQASLETLKAQIKGNGPKAEAFLAAKPPATADDFVIQLTSFRNAELKKLGNLKLIDSHNKVKEDQAFGFIAYAKKGPSSELMEPIFRDKLIVEYLLDTLLACPHLPDSFISMKRERAYTAAERLAYQKAFVAYKPAPSTTPPKLPDTTKDGGSDVFVMDPLRSARVPNLVETTAFELKFESETITMREFMTQLSKFELPLVISSVECELGVEGQQAEEPSTPAAAPTDTSAGGSSPGKSSTPLIVKAKPKVSQHLTIWKVVVEYIHLVTPLEEEAAPDATSTKSTTPAK